MSMNRCSRKCFSGCLVMRLALLSVACFVRLEGSNWTYLFWKQLINSDTWEKRTASLPAQHTFRGESRLTTSLSQPTHETNFPFILPSMHVLWIKLQLIHSKNKQNNSWRAEDISANVHTLTEDRPERCFILWLCSPSFLQPDKLRANRHRLASSLAGQLGKKERECCLNHARREGKKRAALAISHPD